MSKDKATLFVIAGPGKNGIGRGEGSYALLNSETGEPVASHFCSHEEFALGDLWSDREERKKELIAKFGPIEVKLLRETDIDIDALIELNKEFVSE